MIACSMVLCLTIANILGLTAKYGLGSPCIDDDLEAAAPPPLHLPVRPRRWCPCIFNRPAIVIVHFIMPHFDQKKAYVEQEDAFVSRRFDTLLHRWPTDRTSLTMGGKRSL